MKINKPDYLRASEHPLEENTLPQSPKKNPLTAMRNIINSALISAADLLTDLLPASDQTFQPNKTERWLNGLRTKKSIFKNR